MEHDFTVVGYYESDMGVYVGHHIEEDAAAAIASAYVDTNALGDLGIVAVLGGHVDAEDVGTSVLWAPIGEEGGPDAS